MLISLAFIITLMLTSCIDDTVPQAVSEISISVIMPDGFKSDVKFADKVVFLKSNRLTYTGTTDANGIVKFSDIIPDIYSISTSWEIEGNTYIEIADTIVENHNVILSGSIQKQQVFIAKSFELKLSKALKQSLIISKIYGSGTKDNNNKNYVADKYVEIFNNSDETQYIDSTIYIGFVEAHSEIPFPAATNPGYVYARQVFRFVNSAEKIPVLPGHSILVVNSAIDHTQYASTSVNLRNADFEAKSPTYSNNPEVKEMYLSYTAFAGIPYLNLVNGGDNGTFLLKTTENVSKFPIFFRPGKETGDKYMRIPIQFVFDGVEVLKNKAVTGPNVDSKRLQTFVDAGYSFITAISGYTHESIERRVDTSKSNGSRYYLIDTNYSLNDFRVVDDPTPRKYDKALLLAN